MTMFHKIVFLPYGTLSFPVMQVEFDDTSIAYARAQAEAKARHTSAADQNGDARLFRQKMSKQFSGCLAEMAVERFLSLITDDESKLGLFARVVRYDDVRTDGYETADNEFDIRIVFPKADCHVSVGVRSSMSFKEDLRAGVSRLNIIGPYTNSVKLHETPSDFYIQPIFQLKIPNPQAKVTDIDFLDDFTRGLIDLYIVGGCGNDKMAASKKIKSLGQPDTKYRLVGLMDGSDCVTLEREVRQAIKQWFDSNKDKASAQNTVGGEGISTEMTTDRFNILLSQNEGMLPPTKTQTAFTDSRHSSGGGTSSPIYTPGAQFGVTAPFSKNASYEHACQPQIETASGYNGATEKQLNFARRLSIELGIEIPNECLLSKASMSDFISFLNETKNKKLNGDKSATTSPC